jgi:hypothetical protein
MIHRVLHHHPSAKRPSEQVYPLAARHQAGLGQQRMQVIREVPQAAPGVNRCPLRAAEAAQVGRDTVPAPA